MGSISKKEVIASLKETYPDVATIEIGYYGGGDNFDSFHNLEYLDENRKTINHYNSTNENKTLNITQDYMFHIMDHAVNQPDFNNDGSEGKVIFDLINRVVTLEVTYLEDITPEFDGDEDDPDYDEKHDEYWDNVDRDYGGTDMPPEIF